jgi:hypothetical protein
LSEIERQKARASGKGGEDAEFKVQNAKFRRLILFCILHFAFCIRFRPCPTRAPSASAFFVKVSANKLDNNSLTYYSINTFNLLLSFGEKRLDEKQ